MAIAILFTIQSAKAAIFLHHSFEVFFRNQEKLRILKSRSRGNMFSVLKNRKLSEEMTGGQDNNGLSPSVGGYFGYFDLSRMDEPQTLCLLLIP